MAKIDYIVSYCDFSQKEIVKQYEEVTGEAYRSDVNFSYIDFTLLLMLIMKNLPFINKLYIVCKDVQKLPSDTEDLIAESRGKIVRVNESEFLPKGFVTFSSPCIELFLWKIKGLSEQFIYGDDDMIPLRPLKVTDFFKDGKPVMEFKWQNVPFSSLYDLMESNATNLIYDRKKNNDDYECVCYAEHTMKPLTKSICEECYVTYEKFITASLYPVRFFHNFDIDLYLFYGCKYGMITEEALPYRFAYCPNSEENVKMLAERGEDIEDVVCVNDEWWVSKEEKEIVRDMMYKLMMEIYQKA